MHAPREYDTEVFISSILISKKLDFAANRQRIENAQQDISTMKTTFDQLRPIFEDTQQVRFTFDNATAKRLKAFPRRQKLHGLTRRVLGRLT